MLIPFLVGLVLVRWWTYGVARKRTNLSSTTDPKGYMGGIIGMMSWRVALVCFVLAWLLEDPGVFGLSIFWFAQTVFTAGSLVRKRSKQIKNGLLTEPGPEAKFYLFNDGHVTGPFSQDQIGSFLDSGIISGETKCCREGCEEWIPLNNLRQRGEGRGEVKSDRFIWLQWIVRGSSYPVIAFILLTISTGVFNGYQKSRANAPKVKKGGVPSTRSPQLTPLTAKEVWERASPSVVLIEVKRMNGKAQQGSGFVMQHDGRNIIISNRHVVEGAREITVRAGDNQSGSVYQHKISLDTDIAILELPKGLQIPALKEQQAPVSVGEVVYALGYPLGLEKTITNGLINAKDNEAILFSAPVSSGGSGGPMVDSFGQVVGVVTMASKASNETIVQNLNVALPVANIRKMEMLNGPLYSFLEGWMALVEEENWFIQQMENFGVRDLLEVLRNQFLNELDIQSGKISSDEARKDRESFRAQRQQLEKKLGPLDKAIDRAIDFLESSPKRMENWPSFFMGMQDDVLFKRFFDNFESEIAQFEGVTRNSFDRKDFTPALVDSIRVIKSRYKDYAFSIRFCHRMLSIPREDWAALGIVNEALSEVEVLRKSWVIDESEFPENVLQKQFERFQLAYRSPFFPNQGKKSKREWVQQYGGLEGYILRMFRDMASASLQTGKIDEAVTLLETESSYRRYPSYWFAARLKVASGKFEEAYALYEKAYNRNICPFDIQSMAWDWEEQDRLLEEIVTGSFDGLWERTNPLQERMKEWERFVVARGLLSYTKTVHYSVLLTHPKFKELSDFEKSRIIKSYKLLLSKEKNPDSLASFLKLISDDETLPKFR